MDSTRRPTGCPCGEGILNKPKNGTSCHLPANRKFLFHAHFSLQKDFFSNFPSPWFMYFVTESSCFHLVLNLISKEQQKGKIFSFKKIICLQRGAASCNIIWELDVDSFCQLTTGPLSELVAHCWYLLIIFSIPTCRWDPTTSHDYQAGERDYRWCFGETMASFSSRPSVKVTSTKTVTHISNICSVIQIATQLLSQCICQAGSQYLLWIAAYCYLTKVVKNITSEIFREKYRTFSQIWLQIVTSKRLKIE